MSPPNSQEPAFMTSAPDEEKGPQLRLLGLYRDTRYQEVFPKTQTYQPHLVKANILKVEGSWTLSGKPRRRARRLGIPSLPQNLGLPAFSSHWDHPLDRQGHVALRLHSGVAAYSPYIGLVSTGPQLEEGGSEVDQYNYFDISFLLYQMYFYQGMTLVHFFLS